MKEAVGAIHEQSPAGKYDKLIKKVFEDGLLGFSPIPGMEPIISGYIEHALFRLTEKERFVLQQRYAPMMGRTLDDIGKTFGVTRERIRQIEAKALRRVKGLAGRERDGKSIYDYLQFAPGTIGFEFLQDTPVSTIPDLRWHDDYPQGTIGPGPHGFIFFEGSKCPRDKEYVSSTLLDVLKDNNRFNQKNREVASRYLNERNTGKNNLFLR